MPTDDDYDLDDDTTTDEPQTGRNPLRAQMRKQEKELKELREQLAAGQQASRELAFVKAGVDTTKPGAKYFVKGYEGELTVDAIKAAAVEEGFLQAETEDVVTDDEKHALSEIERASNGGRAPGRSEDLGAQMRALAGRKDLSLSQQKAELDALIAQAGIPVQG